MLLSRVHGAMERDAAVGLSKTDLLRELIAEKLTVAAQQIFAVVERTVAGYEAEASGFRQEIERQRRLLEPVLEPEIKVETTDEQLFPNCEPAQPEAAGGGRQLSGHDELHKSEPSVGCISYSEEQMEANEDSVRPALTPTQDQEHLTGLDHETGSRTEATFAAQGLNVPPPSVQSDKKRSGSQQVIKQTHVDLRIRILENSRIQVLSSGVFQKYPVHELRCPCGLQEEDFLNLLRSTYPQLAADQPFDIFITDIRKRLLPLRVTKLTPEEIYRSIKSKGSGSSALYIRLRVQEEPAHGHEAVAGSLSTLAQPWPQMGLLSSKAQLARLKYSRCRDAEQPTHIDLKVRVLEESQIDVLTCDVFQKYPLKELQFPCGLQEADFLNQLRSTFPQLASDKPFDVFTTDQSRRLHPLKLDTLTPEEICRTIKSRGSGHSSLYIRLKSPEDLQATEKHFHLLQKQNAAAKVSLSTPGQARLNSRVQSDKREARKRPFSEIQNPTDVMIRPLEDAQTDALKRKGVGCISYSEEQMEANEDSVRPALTPTQDQEHLTGLDHETGSRTEATFAAQGLNVPPPSVQSDKKRSGRRRVIKQTHVDLRIRILENSRIEVLSTGVFQKYPVHELRCPCGLQEEDFLNLLRSTYPQLAADQPFDIFITDIRKRLLPLMVTKLTPEEIYRSIKSKGSGSSALYIRLHAQEDPQATDEAFHLSQREGATVVSPSIFSQTRPHMGMLSPRVQPAEEDHSRWLANELETHIYFTIRVLDAQIHVLTTRVFQKYPVHELRCPCGLQEEDFLNLLRSTCPQLAADQPFDIFITDNGKRLLPLMVTKLTPEEIYRSILRSGSGKSSLYIRLKAEEEPQATDEKFDPSQRKEAAADSPSISNQTGPHTGLLSSRVQVAEGNHSKHQDNRPQTHICLKIRVLEDSRIDRLTWRVFQKYPLKKVQFPCGLQEADFVNWLRSTFPQMAADKPFDVFTTDKTRKLQPLKVNTLTPEEICRATSNSALYIRLKSPEKLQFRNKHFHLLQENDAAAEGSLSTSSQTGGNLRVESDKKKPRRDAVREMHNHIGLRIRFLENLQTDVVNSQVIKKCPLQELQCPRGMQEADFLDLLKSTFPQLAAEKPFEIFTLDKSKRLSPLKLNTVTPETIHRIIKFNSVLYIQLKPRSGVENVWQRKDAAAKYFPSTSDAARLNSSIPDQQKNAHRVNDLSNNSQHAEVEAGGLDHESFDLWSLQSLLPSESRTDADEASDRDDNWEPDGSDAHQRNTEFKKMRRRQRVKHPNAKVKRSEEMHATDHSDAPPFCKVCQVLRGSAKMLIKHAWSHVDDPQRRCGVCGGCAGTPEELRSHLQSHLKTHSCVICGKWFLSLTGLKGHLSRHNGMKKYKCEMCSKAFPENMFINHKCVRAVDKPYRCDVCQMACVSKMKLQLHRATHTDEKLYSWKPFGKLEALSQHAANHSGHTQVRARAHVCEICAQPFCTGKKLQLHLRSHAGEQQHVCTKCGKRFPGKTHLTVHMRLHAGQKPAQTHQGEEQLAVAWPN